ncbi:hypothetical protein G314FT_16320 [Vagococcus luciliae]|uniref:Uncharacterized protein n=1 Tax=Vagococcus luciliae TaxID=2920380 RepID=A0ABY5P1C9_9ENTE|nr:hypothetical protein G314FT_16320 [Vagococcus luciliae]
MDDSDPMVSESDNKQVLKADYYCLFVFSA